MYNSKEMGFMVVISSDFCIQNLKYEGQHMLFLLVLKKKKKQKNYTLGIQVRNGSADEIVSVIFKIALNQKLG